MIIKRSIISSTLIRTDVNEYAIKEQFLLLLFAQNVTFMIENCIEYKVKMR